MIARVHYLHLPIDWNTPYLPKRPITVTGLQPSVKRVKKFTCAH